MRTGFALAWLSLTPTPPLGSAVIVELTLNDNVVHTFDSPERRAYEQLIRKALRLPNQPALLLLHRLLGL